MPKRLPAFSSGAATASPDDSAARRGPRFTLALTGPFALGKASLAVDVSGHVMSGNRTCATGQVEKGTMTISDADDRFVATVRGGYVSNCGGKASTANKQVRGALAGNMRDAQDTPVSMEFTGTLDEKGNITVTEASLIASQPESFIGKGVAAGSVLDEVAQLRAKVVTYFGVTDGAKGKVDNLVPPDRPQPEPKGRKFQLTVSGHDGEHIVITAEGSFYQDYPDPRNLNLNAPVRLMVGSVEYSVRVNRFYFERESPRSGRIHLVGVLNEPKEGGGPDVPAPAGFLIAEFSVDGMPAGLFFDGGKATVSGRIAALRVGTKLYRPEVEGTFAVVVRG